LDEAVIESLRDFLNCVVGGNEAVQHTMRFTKSNKQPRIPMKTTLSILAAVIGLAASSQAGPSFPGGACGGAPFAPAQGPAYAPQPAGSKCSMTKVELIDSHGRGGGPVVVTRAVNCTGQKCCGFSTSSCCAVKK
jgi:hypothetical protein